MVNPCTDFEVLKLNNLVDWKSNVGDIKYLQDWNG